jgi:3-deoxy-D-manno-octulosonate 8-phosphate phosphatase (KDO 8-P phosphatase)
VAAYADLITEAAGGQGAVREAIEALLVAQDRWAEALAPYLETP